VRIGRVPVTSEEHLATANPEADPDEIARFVSDLRARGIIILPPDETVPEGYTILSSSDIVRLTNPVVWSRPPCTPVALEWMGAHVCTKEEYDL
jgi:hypothetical protein